LGVLWIECENLLKFLFRFFELLILIIKLVQFRAHRHGVRDTELLLRAGDARFQARPEEIFSAQRRAQNRADVRDEIKRNRRREDEEEIMPGCQAAEALVAIVRHPESEDRAQRKRQRVAKVRMMWLHRRG